MKRREILQTSGMPLAAPSYGRPPFRIVGRAALTISYESDLATFRAALPDPLKTDGAVVTVQFIDAAESPFGAYRACAISMSATLDGTPVEYCHALHLDQEGPLFASREIWGFPAMRATPELILGENRVTGVLDLGFGRVVNASIPVAEENDLAEAAADTARTLATCKIIPGAGGNPAIAQLVTVAPETIAIKHYWSGDGQLEIEPESLLAPFPVRKILSGSYVFADMTLPYGTVAHDYLSNPEKS